MKERNGKKRGVPFRPTRIWERTHTTVPNAGAQNQSGRVGKPGEAARARLVNKEWKKGLDHSVEDVTESSVTHHPGKRNKHGFARELLYAVI